MNFLPYVGNFWRILRRRNAAAALIFLASGSLSAQLLDFDAPPIGYASTPTQDPASKLARRLEKGETTLRFDPEHGYLPALLEALKIPQSSQVLVFSKTSFQRDLISPAAPRALYFNDETYVGFVRGGPVLEVASVDPRLGGVFFTLAQDASSPPKLQRLNAECTQCHASALTKGVPGFLVRSVYSDASGQPVLKAGTFLTDHTSPFKERWGGWYVTGTHGSIRHLGNTFLEDPSGNPGTFDFTAGANLTDLSPRFSTRDYLSPSSDIVALLILEHQAQLHNLVTSAAYQARLALRDEEAIREMMKEPPGPPTESTRRRFEYASRPLLKYLLLVGEAGFESPVRGTSSFVQEFAARGPKDSKGRSLRELDLSRRLFRYPLSYLIYSESFDQLPEAFGEHVFTRLHEILSGKDTSKDFAGLTQQDRQATLEILRDTRTGLPACWKNAETAPRSRL